MYRHKLFLIGYGSKKSAKYKKLKTNGVKSQVTVVSIESSAGIKGRTYFPGISFTTLENETILKKYNIDYKPGQYKVGDSVEVFYDAADTRMFIKDDVNTRFLGTTFLFIGIGMFILCAVRFLMHPASF